MYKLITSSRDSDDFSIGFDCSRGRRKQKLTINKRIKGKYHPRIMLKDIFGFAEYHEKAIYGLGFNLTLTKNTDNNDLIKANATIVGKVKNDSIEWYVAHFAPSISNQAILSNQTLSKTPTELQFVEKVERSVLMKEVNTQNLWNFELGTKEDINIPIWIFVGFKQRDREDSQNLHNDIFLNLR